MKTYVLYHENCPDGCGAALAAYMKFGEEAEYIQVNYGKPPPNLGDPGIVYIVDFSYPANVLRDFSDAMSTVVVLDHHATAQKDLSMMEESGRLSIRFDMSKSGSVLAWEYFHSDKPVPKFILYLQDRDLWKWELPSSREVSAAIGSYAFDFRMWAIWLKEHEQDELIENLALEGQTCLRLKNQQVDIMARNNTRVRIETYSDERKAALELWHSTEGQVPLIDAQLSPGVTGRYVVPCANASVFFSEVGEKLLEIFPSAPFAAYYFDRADGRRQWGIRARKGFDAATLIAKPMGGGGHPQACGFTTPL